MIMNILKSFTGKEKIILIVIVLLGLILRLYPGNNHYIWTYDQARDAYRSRSILEKKNIVIVGPQTEYVGLNHGPISYYFLAPFYYLSNGDPNLPVLAMIFFNISTILPLFLLTEQLFKNKRISLLSTLLFTIAYSQIEYARWLSNISLVVPFLAWTYFFLFKTYKKLGKGSSLLLGLFLGLAVQSEIFLLYLIAVIYLLFYFSKQKLNQWFKFHLGLIVGLLPLIVAELKFGFLASKTFFSEFLFSHSNKMLQASQSINDYLNHLGLASSQTIVGLSYAMGLWFLIMMLIFIAFEFKKFKENTRQALSFLLILFFSHSILFTFFNIDAVFLDLPIYLPLIILVAFVLNRILDQKRLLLAASLILLIIFSQLNKLYSNTINNTPYESYNFIQEGILFSQKIEIAATMYEMTDADKPFSLAVLGTPYGVRTVWASVFEQYSQRHNVPVPVWFGFYANGYPADDFFQTQDFPEKKHILLIESNQYLIDEYTKLGFMDQQDEATQLVKEKELYGYTIQLRVPKEK